MSEEVRTTSSTGGQKGVKEQRYDLIPVRPLAWLAILFGRGARKYDAHNWRRGYEWGKSYAAVQRHMNAFWGGEDMDACKPECPEDCREHTNVPHVINAAWHCMVLAEFMETHPNFDDRYLPDGPPKIEWGPLGRPVTRDDQCEEMCPEGEHDEADMRGRCGFLKNVLHTTHLSVDGQCTWGKRRPTPS